MLLNLSRLRKQQARRDTMTNTQHHYTIKQTHTHTQEDTQIACICQIWTYTVSYKHLKKGWNKKLKILMGLNGSTMKRERQRGKKEHTLDIWDTIELISAALHFQEYCQILESAGHPKRDLCCLVWKETLGTVISHVDWCSQDGNPSVLLCPDSIYV